MLKKSSLLKIVAITIITCSLFIACSEDSDNVDSDNVNSDTVDNNGEFICNIKPGDDISDVFKEYNLEDGSYEYDYECDPYGDGCTDVKKGIYDGTLTDFEKEYVLDYMMTIYFTKDNDNWRVINLGNEDLNQYNDVIKLKIDINGVSQEYNGEPYSVLSVDYN